MNDDSSLYPGVRIKSYGERYIAEQGTAGAGVFGRIHAMMTAR